jgi:hypothetical protein
MRYYEIICEAGSFNTAQPYDYYLVGISNQTHEFEDNTGSRFKHPVEKTKYAFESDNGLHYIVHCNFQHHELTVSFTVMGGTRTGGHYHLNGEGDAFRVLSTVSHIIATYVRADPPRAILFTADRAEPSRVKLYDFMCKHANRFFPGYHLEDRDARGRSVKYRLVRPLTRADHDTDAREAREDAEKAARRAEQVRQYERDMEARRAAREREPEYAPIRGQHRTFDDLLNSGDEDLLRLLGM